MLNIYPPSAFDVYRKVQIHCTPACDAACDAIYKATQGVGTDEKVLVKVLGPHSPNDRGLIVHRYKELYNTSLRDVVKSETSGDFNYLLQMTCMNMPQTEAFIVYHAMHGIGTSENLIYPVLMGRTNDEINLLKKAFFEMYGTDLSVMLNDDLSGDFKAIMALASNEPMVEYKQSFHTQSKAEEDAELIYKAGEGKWGTDEGSFIKTILSAPPKHLTHIEQAYKAKYGHGLVKAIENEFSGTSTDALVFHVRLTLDPWNTLADYIDDAMKGIGTDESALSAGIVRYHPYLSKIKHAYQEKYKVALRDRVQAETSGSYQELLLHIIDAPRSIGDYYF